MNPESMLNKPDTNYNYYMTPLTYNTQKQAHLQRQKTGCQGLEGEKMGSYCPMVTEFTELLFETIKSLEMDSDGAYNIVNFINANEMYN